MLYVIWFRIIHFWFGFVTCCLVFGVGCFILIVLFIHAFLLCCVCFILWLWMIVLCDCVAWFWVFGLVWLRCFLFGGTWWIGYFDIAGYYALVFAGWLWSCFVFFIVFVVCYMYIVLVGWLSVSCLVCLLGIVFDLFVCF